MVKSCLQKSVLMNTDKQKRVNWIPLTCVFGQIMYTIICKTTRYVECSKRFWARYQSDQDVDHWTNSEKLNLWKIRYVSRKNGYNEELVLMSYTSWVFDINQLHQFSLHTYSDRFSILIGIMCFTRKGGTVWRNCVKLDTVASSIIETKYIVA